MGWARDHAAGAHGPKWCDGSGEEAARDNVYHVETSELALTEAASVDGTEAAVRPAALLGDKPDGRYVTAVGLVGQGMGSIMGIRSSYANYHRVHAMTQIVISQS